MQGRELSEHQGYARYKDAGAAPSPPKTSLAGRTLSTQNSRKETSTNLDPNQ